MFFETHQKSKDTDMRQVTDTRSINVFQGLQVSKRLSLVCLTLDTVFITITREGNYINICKICIFSLCEIFICIIFLNIF